MPATDQGAIVRLAIAERIEHETDQLVVFDAGFGYVTDEHGVLVIGYLIVFKADSPIPGKPALMHEAHMIGHTPTDDQLDDVVHTAVAILQEKAAQQLAAS